MSHARIAETYWTDPKIRRLSPEGKLLFLYLLSNPHRHYSGLYYLPIGLIPIETGLKGDTVKLELSILADYKILLYDTDTETIFIRKMFLYQSGGEAGLNLTDKQKIGVVNHLKSLHGTFLIDTFLKIYKGLGLKVGNPIETPSDEDWPQSQSQSQSQSKSQSQEETPPQEAAPLPPKKKSSPKPQKTFLPENFTLSDSVKAWALENNYGDLHEHLEAFKRKATMKGYAYVNWDMALMEAIREDWAKLRSGNGQNRQPPLKPGESHGNNLAAETDKYSARAGRKVVDLDAP